LLATGELASSISASGATVLGWWAGGRLPALWAGRSLFACLTAITAVGGFAAASHHDKSRAFAHGTYSSARRSV
jgi:hypothetical protein